MKVAFVNDTFLEGRGADVVVYELAKRLGKNNDLFVLSGDTNISEENFKFIKIDLPKLFTKSIKDFFYLQKMKILEKQIKELDERYSFDKIVVFHGGLSPAFKNNKKVVYVWLGSPPTKNILRKITSNYFQKLMINSKIITISKYLNENLIRIGAKKTKIILLGVSDEFKQVKTKESSHMLYVGRLEKHKRVDQLIKLSATINFPLKIIGYGLEEENLKKLAKKINAPISFLGRVSRKELVKNYQNCSFFVSASEWEGFGLIFVEAGACAKPSIGYNVGSIPEVIINNKTGFVVDNFKEFINSAKLLKEDRALRIKMGKNARIFSKKFNWDKVAIEYEKELNKK